MQWLRVTLNLVVLVCLLACLGCGDDDPAGPPPPAPLPSELVGTWNITSWTLNGQPQPLVDVFEDPSSVSGTSTINSNRTFSSEERDGSGAVTYTDSGTLTVSGNQFTVTITMVNGSPITPESFSGMWAVSGNELTMTLTGGSDPATITFTK